MSKVVAVALVNGSLHVLMNPDGMVAPHSTVLGAAVAEKCKTQLCYV